jgi:hypothetical protein
MMPGAFFFALASSFFFSFSAAAFLLASCFWAFACAF